MPDAGQAEQHRQVLRERRLREMASMACAPSRNPPKPPDPTAIISGRPIGRPDGIAPADPIPEAEHTIGRDAEGLDLVERCRDGREMVRHRLLRRAPRRSSAGAECGIGHGLDGGEGLRRDDEQGGRRIEPRDGIGEMRAVDIRDEMAARAVVIGRQRQGDHDGSEVRAADADVDDIGETPAARRGDRSIADARGEGAERGKHRVDIGHHILAINENGRIRAVSQGCVKHRTVFGRVDLRTRQHGVALGLDLAGAREVCEQFERARVDGGLRVIEQQVFLSRGEGFEASGIRGEQVAQALAIGGLPVGRECVPSGCDTCGFSHDGLLRPMPLKQPRPRPAWAGRLRGACR